MLAPPYAFVIIFICLSYAGHGRRLKSYRTPRGRISAAAAAEAPEPSSGQQSSFAEMRQRELSSRYTSVNSTLFDGANVSLSHSQALDALGPQISAEVHHFVRPKGLDALGANDTHDQRNSTHSMAATAANGTKSQRDRTHALDHGTHYFAGLTHGSVVTEDAETKKVFIWLCILVVGKLLQDRFSDKDASAIKKMLLQCLVPATILQGISKQRFEMCHVSYFVGGMALVMARLASSMIASSIALGSTCKAERSKLRRTAMFQISTTASALSVFPFLSEFAGREYVGLGGIMELPMKLYMLLCLPWLLRKFGGSSSEKDTGSDRKRYLEVFTMLVKDPVTIALVAGLAISAATGGAGTEALGFLGEATDCLVAAQMPVLCLLIGLKLKCESSTPLISTVLILAGQGILLLMIWGYFLIAGSSNETARFIILFSQGAPSVVGTGIINAAVAAGVQGYSTDFAFDIVRLALPISACLQCIVGILGAPYQHTAGLLGIALLAVAAVLRILFFQSPERCSGSATVVA